jgi:serine/threonine protein kinase
MNGRCRRTQRLREHRSSVHAPDLRARFLRATDVAAGLGHPNIVAIHNRGSTDEGRLWIALQYVDGPTPKPCLPGR